MGLLPTCLSIQCGKVLIQKIKYDLVGSDVVSIVDTQGGYQWCRPYRMRNDDFSYHQFLKYSYIVRWVSCHSSIKSFVKVMTKKIYSFFIECHCLLFPKKT